MSINLVAGFQANIQIKDKEGTVLYQKPCSSSEEVKNFISKNGKSKSGWSLIVGAFIPIRTQNLQNFSKDFFLPTFVNFCLKINNKALKIFASIFAIALDVFTAPIRLLTTPFRIYYNYQHPEAEHPIINLIKGNDQSKKAMEDNFVNLCYEIQNVQISISSGPDEKGNTFQNASKSMIKGVMQIALKSIPGGIKNKSSEEEVAATYQGMNGEWNLGHWSTGSSSIYSYAC